MSKIILASKSPRRKDLLCQMGLEFTVQSKEIPEELESDEKAEVAVSKLALRKALAVAEVLAEGVVIGADTVVVLEDKILGKPESPHQAREMLLALSGKKHHVITGVGIVEAGTGKNLRDWEVTGVCFRHLSKLMIDSYISSGEPLDKAGAYGIQGKAGLFVTKIDGCYFNVVGLPIAKVALMLEKLGHEIWR